MAAQKRGMSDCPFCRTPLPDNDADRLAMIQARVAKKDADAIYFLGGQYWAGRLGLQKDMGKAVELYTKAAELGSIEALFSLGGAYERGVGVEQDKIKAVEFLTKSAISLWQVMLKVDAIETRSFRETAKRGQKQANQTMGSDCHRSMNIGRLIIVQGSYIIFNTFFLFTCDSAGRRSPFENRRFPKPVISLRVILCRSLSPHTMRMASGECNIWNLRVKLLYLETSSTGFR